MSKGLELLNQIQEKFYLAQQNLESVEDSEIRFVSAIENQVQKNQKGQPLYTYKELRIGLGSYLKEIHLVFTTKADDVDDVDDVEFICEYTDTKGEKISTFWDKVDDFDLRQDFFVSGYVQMYYEILNFLESQIDAYDDDDDDYDDDYDDDDQ